jgi:hypothetical protein
MRILVCYKCGEIRARPGVSFDSVTVGSTTQPVAFIHCGYEMIEYEINAERITMPLFHKHQQIESD